MTETVRPTFGPSALATPANALTVARLLATPIFVGLILSEGATWLTVAVGVLVAGSDGVDGWVARRQGTTRSGAFLDPLADKFIVLGAFCALAAKDQLPWAPVVLMGAREMGMSAYRSWAGRRGVSIPARRSAKLKTLVQDLAIATCLVPPSAGEHALQLGAVWLATALTLGSGAQYLWDGRLAVRSGGSTAAAGGPAVTGAPFGTTTGGAQARGTATGGVQTGGASVGAAGSRLEMPGLSAAAPPNPGDGPPADGPPADGPPAVSPPPPV